MLQLLLTVAAIVWATSSVFANDEQDCFQGQEPQLRIKGCSEMIERAPEDATAYHNRAFAYALAGDIDNAIEGLLEGHCVGAGQRKRLCQSWPRLRE